MKKKLLATLCMVASLSMLASCGFGTEDSSSDSVDSSSSTCTHTYDNACDADCNVCGEERTPSDHVYDGEGDKYCDICGEERELNKYTVTFDVDGGSAVEAQMVEYGTTAAELKNFTSTKTGYEFAGWTLEDGTAIPDGATVTDDITVKAAWNVVTYSAKIARVDGSEETVEFTIENKAEKLAAIALTANNAQYTYAWATALPSELALNNEQVFTETRTVNKYTVTFDVDGGSAVEAQMVEYGTTADELANFTSTKTGYEFAGWTLEDGTAIPDGATVTDDITVKAAWNVVTYSAKIARVDGSEETVEFTIENKAEKLAAIALTANDAQYTYAWATALPSELALNNEQVFTETRTVNKYTVTFDVDGGSAVEAQMVEYGTTADELANFTSTKTGYEFAGWTLEDGTAIPDGATVTGDITVKADWTASTNTAYNVEIYLETLSGYPETAVQTIAQTGTTDTAVVLTTEWMATQDLEIPEGYALDHDKSVFSGTIAADGSLVLKVYLKLNEYTVTIDGVASTAKHGSTIALPENPTNDGYIFKEWQVDGVKIDETYVITANTTVVAAWYVDLTETALFEVDLTSSEDYTISTEGIGEVTAISMGATSLPIANSTTTSVTIANGTIVASGLTGGEYSNLVLATETAEYMVKFIAVTKYLNAENVTSWATLKSTIEADMNGYYVLTSNIDLTVAGSNSQRVTRAIGFGSVSGTTHTGYTEFNGTIDGRGYAIQNMEYNWRSDGGKHDHAFIDVIGANGVVKNLALTNIRVVVNAARSAGLAWTNKGAIENCYVEYTNTAGVGGQNAEWGQAAMVLINEGTVKDCIAELTATTTSLGTNRLAIVTKNTGTVSNVNAIVIITADVDPVVVFIDSGTTINSAYVTSINAFFTANTDANYTSSYWTFDETNATVSFGSAGQVL